MSTLCQCGKPRRLGAQNKLNKTCGDKSCQYITRTGAIKKARTTFDCKQCNETVYVITKREKQTFCSHKCANDYQSRFKILKLCKHCNDEFQPWTSGRNDQQYCSHKCYKESGALREHNIQNNLNLQKNNKPTRPEQFLYDYLDNNNVHYIKQHRIVHWVVDCYVPATNTIIQVDGDYWHGHPVTHPAYEPRIKKRVGIDKSQNTWFEKMDYNLIRIWESEIYENIRERLQAVTRTFTK